MFNVQGAAFNQSIFPTTLSFYLNGKHLPENDVSGIRGEVYPAICGAKPASPGRSERLAG
jgi:hypothetical protein